MQRVRAIVVCYSRTVCYVVFLLTVVCSLGIRSLAPNLQWPYNVIGECCALIALLSVVMATLWYGYLGVLLLVQMGFDIVYKR